MEKSQNEKYQLVKSYQPSQKTYTLAIYVNGRCYEKHVASSAAEMLALSVWLQLVCDIKNDVNPQLIY